MRRRPSGQRCSAASLPSSSSVKPSGLPPANTARMASTSAGRVASSRLSADGPLVDAAEVDPLGLGGREHAADVRRRRLHAQGVEDVLVVGARSPACAGRAPAARVSAVHALGDGLQAAGPVVHRVHAGHDGQQHLRGADVARGLLAADVLLARLQRHAQRAPALRVLGHADDAARHDARVGVLRGEERRVRAAVAHAARRSAGRCPPRRPRRTRPAASAASAPAGPRRRSPGHRPRAPSRRRRGSRAPRRRWPGTAAARRRTSWRSGPTLRWSPTTTSMPSGSARVRTTSIVCGWQVSDDEEGAAVLSPLGAQRQGHGLGGGGALVEQRGVGDLQAGEVDHHGLEVEQRLQPALGDLRLVGRVLRCTSPGSPGCCAG